MKKYITYTFIILFITSCSKTSEVSNSNNPNTTNNNFQEWLVPLGEIRDGGPGKDGIPSIDTPIFVDANSSDANYLDDDDLVIGIVKGSQIKAYPHIVMDWHEVVNDNFDGFPVTISYCPLTGTAFGWNGIINGQITTFGVSGLLYNTNLILYDRNSDSNWSQLRLQCINGSQISSIPETESVIETTWGVWKNMFPSTKVLSLFTGFNRDYGTYPYGDYITNNDFLLFNVNPTNNTLPSKERVFALIDNNLSKAYRFENFNNGKVVNETFNGNQYLIVGNNNIINAFKLSGSTLGLSFQYNYSNSEEFFIDNEGNKWNIFGKAIQGPRVGQKLTPSKSVVSYWFAIASFYPNPEIYQ
ncbi:DUF3179 domain-containing protein [Olleya sp. R77988]|uniref:DUF3179 domain-containing protein n=1 Tax=Olleya sp. R77988 TaxID=3093875 RepID=UPI0037C98377